ncbi:hypothetical protein ACFOWM_03650 [Ferruginibacter yonginensis]|uniref:DNA mismatch repair proteins mutS family domain-containing protein n=1 Tax=Ferruginibacter yonginensis TaxID=1310416 RepID=A0ABV8QSR7_9BACT
MSNRVFYETRLATLQQQLKTHQKRTTTFAVVRLGNVFAIVLLMYFLWSHYQWLAIVSTVILIAIFIRIIYKDVANRAAIKHLQLLITINENELLALDEQYHPFKNGQAFTRHDHFYANDMDIFGAASLYQMINRTTSEIGAATLANWLLQPATIDTITNRQEAIKELSNQQTFTQQIQALGKANFIKNDTIASINKWLQSPNQFLQYKHWQWLRCVLPAISISITALYVVDIITINWWYLSLFIFAAVAFQLNKIIAPIHNQLSHIVDELNILSQSLACIETQTFHSPYLQQLQTQLISQNKTASTQIKQVTKILERLDLRYNVVIAIPLNILLLWHLQQILDLEKWKMNQQAHLDNWLQTLATFEALNSMAVLHFNQPNWCFPVLKQQHFFMKATALGHPLIKSNKRVNNYIDIETAGQIMLITGSNMAGKSTYLRSIGINTILAMAGAPVCASHFELSPVQLISSMRIADNLEESTSTFYAELKKLKTVIEKVNAGEKVLILLDEILRGTNTLDRHTGSKALIQQIIKQKAAAILATHDVDLAALQQQYPHQIMNYHFDAQINGEELFFDYKLKDGVCTNMNASLLMKKIGLDV